MTIQERAAERKQIAEIILSQLGGSRFLAMTGAKKLTIADRGLNFVLPSTKDFVKNGINVVRITLTAADDYTVEFLRIGRAPRYATTVVREANGVYCDNLREVFEQETGLRTSL